MMPKTYFIPIFSKLWVRSLCAGHVVLIDAAHLTARPAGLCLASRLAAGLFVKFTGLARVKLCRLTARL